MAAIAVDAVLLPSEQMSAKAMELNAELAERFGAKVVLHKDTCLPHISLAMGCIEEQNIADVTRLLEKTAAETTVKELAVTGIHTATNILGEEVCSFVVRKTDELQALHESIMRRLSAFLSSDVTAEMIYGNEPVAETTLLWIVNYSQNAAFENFLPHITLGYGRIENGPFPIAFAVSKLALCHLGNHCTCRRVLTSIDF